MTRRRNRSTTTASSILRDSRCSTSATLHQPTRRPASRHRASSVSVRPCKTSSTSCRRAESRASSKIGRTRPATQPIDWSDPNLLLQPTAATAAVPSDSFDPSQLTSVLDPSQLTMDLTQLLATLAPRTLPKCWLANSRRNCPNCWAPNCRRTCSARCKTPRLSDPQRIAGGPAALLGSVAAQRYSASGEASSK